MKANKEIDFLPTNLFSKIIYFITSSKNIRKGGLQKDISEMGLFEDISIFQKSTYFFRIANCHLQCKKRIFTSKKTFALQRKLSLKPVSDFIATTFAGSFFAVNGEQVKLKIGSVLNA